MITTKANATTISGRNSNHPEVLILISGFDETFDQNIFSRMSYTFEEFEWGGKFIKAVHYNEDGQPIVDLGKLSKFEKHAINHLIAEAVSLN